MVTSSSICLPADESTTHEKHKLISFSHRTHSIIQPNGALGITGCANVALRDTPDLFMLCCAVAFLQRLPLPALIVDLQTINGDGASLMTLHHQSTLQVQGANINIRVIDTEHSIMV